MAEKPVIHLWEGTTAEDIDEWLDADFFLAWNTLRANLPLGMTLKGICPVTEAGRIHWAALAWSPGVSWRGLGTTRFDAVKALTDMIDKEFGQPEQASRSDTADSTLQT